MMNKPVLLKKQAPAPVIGEPLHLKYRPKTFSDVIGQDGTVHSLLGLVDGKRAPHAFLFTGPSGVGKTTLARLIASYYRCKGPNIIEVDAARYSGIDAMRELLTGARYAALGENPTKFYIVDECHALSKATWNTLLKGVEEPEDHVYWAFCTTEPDKVPSTIRTRCHSYDLKPVHWETIAEYLTTVAKTEDMLVSEEFIDMAARRAMGSVRQALVYLSMLNGVKEKEQALALLEQADDGEKSPAIVLARMLVSGKGASMLNALKLIKEMDDVNPESIRLTVLNYTAAVMLNSTTDKAAAQMAAILQAFSGPFNASERQAPLLLAVASVFLE